MKRMIIVCLMLSFALCIFANDIQSKTTKNIFKMPKVSYKFENVKKFSTDENNFNKKLEIDAKIAKISSIVFMSLSSASIIGAFCYLPFASNFVSWYSYMGGIISLGIFLGINGGVLLYGGCKESSLISCDDRLYQKYEIVKLMRNVGIILFATSFLPGVASIPHFLTGWQHSISIANICCELIMSATQLILGLVYFAIGQAKCIYLKDMVVSPELSLVHDDKKEFDEGYSVNIGLRVRL